MWHLDNGGYENTMYKETKENYLKTILTMTEKNDGVRNTDLAKNLGIKKPSVTTAVKRLEEEGYVSHDDKGLIVLTSIGLRVAQNTFRRHLTFVELLTSQGVPLAVAEHDACKLEHDVGPESYDAFVRINALLKSKKAE